MSNFPAARLKIDRAYTHIHELQALADWYCVPDLHTAVVQNDAATGCAQIVLQSEPIPPQTALIFGDAIHALRSAFDHAAYALTTGKAKKEFISFPFGERLQDLKSTINGGQIKVAGPAVLDAIVEKIRPYRINEDTGEHGNSPIWMLNRLDNIDKHRELLLTVSKIQTHINHLSFSNANVIFQNNTFITQGGDNGAVMMLPGTVTHGHGTTTVQIIINEPQFFYGEPVIPTLHQLAELTSGALDILEPLA